MNPIDLEILWSRLISIVDEGSAALRRTAFSTAVRESNDCTVVLLDEEGRVLAQPTYSSPGFIGTAALTLQAMLQLHPRDSLRRGDVLFTNDPWIGTGHLPDTTLAAALFFEDRIVGFVVTIAHVADIGGRQWSADAKEVFEEGIRIPIIKLVESGAFNELAMSILKSNLRVPDEVAGDINAQISAMHVIQQGLHDMLLEYNIKDLRDIAAAIFETSRRAALREIQKIPPGRYVGEVQTDGWDEPVQIRVTVDVTATGVTVDFLGSSPQVNRGLNETYNHARSYTIFPFKCLFSPDLPNNDGFTSLFDVRAPEGSVVNARFPAAVGARHLIGHAIPTAIFDALAGVLPDKVQADGGAPLWSIVLRGTDSRRGRNFSSILFLNGGMGAMQARDGMSAGSFPANVANTPIEVTESLSPLLFRTKRLLERSGGDGERRGGMGQVVSIESRWPGQIQASLLTDRTRVPAKGLHGGGPGKLGHVHKNGVAVAEPKGVITLELGDVLELALPGGGGFGADTRSENAE